MLHASRHDDQLAFANYGFAIAKLHPQHAFDYQEKFVFNLVAMANEFFLEINRFHDRTAYKAFTMPLTAVRTRCVVSACEASEYRRNRFSVPEARTIPHPISPR